MWRHYVSKLIQRYVRGWWTRRFVIPAVRADANEQHALTQPTMGEKKKTCFFESDTDDEGDMQDTPCSAGDAPSETLGKTNDHDRGTLDWRQKLVIVSFPRIEIIEKQGKDGQMEKKKKPIGLRRGWEKLTETSITPGHTAFQ
eukprot:471523-Prymnesium_polylepis.1